MPDTITTIGNGSFEHATLPKTFEIGKNIKVFGQYCFNHTDLGDAKVIISNNTRISAHAFDATNIKEIIYDANPEWYGYKPFSLATIEKLSISNKDIIIPTSLFENATIKERN